MQDHGKPDSLGAGHNLQEMENTGEYGDGVALVSDLHAHSKKLTEGENNGKFQCSLCGKITNQKKYAFSHVENIHFPGSYEYECDQCGEKFDTKNKVYQHRSLVHNSKK